MEEPFYIQIYVEDCYSGGGWKYITDWTPSNDITFKYSMHRENAILFATFEEFDDISAHMQESCDDVLEMRIKDFELNTQINSMADL